MSVFDTLAESRYQQWLKAHDRDQQSLPEHPPQTASRKSFEGLLFQDILSTLEQAASTSCKRERLRLIQHAHNLETQLLVSLEKQRLPMVAQTLQQSIRIHRQSLL
ncbi:MAG: hypothetical protein KTR32_24050 [Granulosicoccus sp.]|nr:hypothetical protein [Granulosicoccus sp.]